MFSCVYHGRKKDLTKREWAHIAMLIPCAGDAIPLSRPNMIIIGKQHLFSSEERCFCMDAQPVMGKEEARAA